MRKKFSEWVHFLLLSVLPIDKKDNYEEDIDIGIFTVVIGNIRPT
jgi:hypothetical protein